MEEIIHTGTLPGARWSTGNRYIELWLLYISDKSHFAPSVLLHAVATERSHVRSSDIFSASYCKLRVNVSFWTATEEALQQTQSKVPAQFKVVIPGPWAAFSQHNPKPKPLKVLPSAWWCYRMSFFCEISDLECEKHHRGARMHC